MIHFKILKIFNNSKKVKISNIMIKIQLKQKKLIIFKKLKINNPSHCNKENKFYLMRQKILKKKYQISKKLRKVYLIILTILEESLNEFDKVIEIEENQEINETPESKQILNIEINQSEKKSSAKESQNFKSPRYT